MTTSSNILLIDPYTGERYPSAPDRAVVLSSATAGWSSGVTFEVQRLAPATLDELQYESRGTVAYMTNVDPSRSNVAMPGAEAYEYYGTGRGLTPNWVNRSAVMFFEPFLQFNAIDAGKHIKSPTLVIHSDAALVPDGARRFYRSVPAKKDVYWMKTANHIAFYDQPEVVDAAVERATAWLDNQLKVGRR